LGGLSLGKQSHSQAAAHLPLLLNRTGGEKKMRKPVSQDKDRETGCHLLLQAKQNSSGEM